MFLALCAVGGVVVLGVLGLCFQNLDARRAALSQYIVEAVQSQGERDFAAANPEPSPMDFWAPLVGTPSLFVFTVSRHREEYAFVAAITRVLPRGLVVTDLVEESIYLSYDALQYRPARPADVQDDNMVITPPNIEEDLDEEPV